MPRTHLSQAILALLNRRAMTAASFAAQVGLTGATISRACAGDRLSIDSLKALCTKQDAESDGLLLLIAHLCDEVDRAGRRQTEVVIAADKQEAPDDIKLLADQIRHDDELAAIVHDLAQLVRSLRRRIARGDYPVLERPNDEELPPHDVERPA